MNPLSAPANPDPFIVYSKSPSGNS